MNELPTTSAQEQLDAVQDFAAYLSWDRGLSPHTVRAYVGDVESLRTWTQLTVSQLVEQLSLPLVRQWMAAAVEDGASRSSMARRSAALRAWGVWLERTGRLPTNPMARLAYPRTGSTAPRVPSVTAVAAALDGVPPESARDLRNVAMVETLYAGGLRVAELCALDVDDVDLTHGLATVTGKGSKQRRVPLGVPCLDAVRAWIHQGRPHMVGPTAAGALFVGERGRRIDQRQVRTVVRAYSGRQDPSRAVSPHALRHAAATHLLDGGADIRTVQEFLGHASLASTQIYTHVSADRMRQSYRDAHPRA